MRSGLENISRVSCSFGLSLKHIECLSSLLKYRDLTHGRSQIFDLLNEQGGLHKHDVQLVAHDII